MLIFSLRREARLSGEAASFRLLQEVVAELGIALEGAPAQESAAAPALAAVRRLAQLQRIAATHATRTLLVKIPTAAQLPLACWATRTFRGRLVFWIDGLLWSPLEAPSQWRRSLLTEPLLTLARAAINNAVWTRLVAARPLEVVVASRTQQQELASRLPGARIHVVPNGTLTACPPSEPAARGTFTAGYIGHAYLVKGVWEMLAAYRQLATRGVACAFRCALSGLGSDHFRRHAIAAGMEMYGEVDKRWFYQSIDLLVAPYWVAWGTQTFPNILLESLQYGVPVLTTDVPVCRELFPDDLAYFVPPNDPGTLAARLEQIVHRELPRPSPERLRAHFEAHYSRPRIVEGWREVLCGGGPAALEGRP